MSANIVSGLATFGTLIGDALANYALIMPGVRSIGDLYPHVVVDETHRDELAITQHPVEFGTPVTDHAFMQPFTIDIKCGWSDSTAQTSGYVQAVYQALLKLQASRVPFNIASGKRAYKSMLLRSVLVKTDPDSEYALMVVASAQQIVITNTQTTAAASPVSNGSTKIGDVNGLSASTVAMTPVVAGDNGIGTIPAGSVTPDGFGAITWPNDVSGAGTQSLAANASAIPNFPGQP